MLGVEEVLRWQAACFAGYVKAEYSPLSILSFYKFRVTYICLGSGSGSSEDINVGI